MRQQYVISNGLESRIVAPTIILLITALQLSPFFIDNEDWLQLVMLIVIPIGFLTQVIILLIQITNMTAYQKNNKL